MDKQSFIQQFVAAYLAGNTANRMEGLLNVGRATVAGDADFHPAEDALYIACAAWKAVEKADSVRTQKLHDDIDRGG